MRWLRPLCIGLALVLPVFLMHGRGIAEGLVALIGAGFLVRSGVEREWGWLRTGWVRLALLWWGWVVVCSIPWGWVSVGQAVGAGRFVLLVAALEHWALEAGWVRRWLARLLRWAALYLAVQSLVQFAFGRNLFGWPRNGDGELTGPYKNPRAGAPLALLLFPAVLPVMVRWGRVGSLLLLAASVGVMVLIGQRMPVLLTLLGLAVTGVLLPRLRPVVLAAAAAGALLVAASPVIAPPTFHRLVQKFSDQMGHFPDSPYGQIAARAVSIAEARPLTGVGFDGFRRACEEPAYFHGWGGGDGGGAAMCVQHPHNFYLQALVEGGLPGLLFFVAMALAWLGRLFRGLWRDPVPLRVGLFVAALLHLWPVASTTAWTSMPLGGWFFVLLGLGLAETRHYIGTDSHKRA